MDVKKRRTRYLSQVEKSVTVLFSGNAPRKSGDQHYPFSVNKNFFYLTNIDEPNLILLIVKGKYMIREILFIEEQDEKKALWVGETISSFDAAKKSMLCEKDIMHLKDFDHILSSYLQINRDPLYGEIKNVYFDLERHDINDVSLIGNRYALKVKEAYPHIIINNCYNIIANMRLYKDENEIEEIKKAITITNEAILTMMQKSHGNIYEYQLESHFDQVLKYHNTVPSFKTIAAGGKNATILHYEDNKDLIKDGELVLFDVGCLSNNYASDISRTFPVNGVFSPRQKEIYEIVLEANKKTIEYLKPGITWMDFYEYGKRILAEGLIRIGKIKELKEIDKYYYHSLGHSLGLDVHDIGLLDEPMKEGIVVTVEPGLYIADEGIGIRIEDDILITSNGNINLSRGIIKEIDEIVNYMKK